MNLSYTVTQEGTKETAAPEVSGTCGFLCVLSSGHVQHRFVKGQKTALVFCPDQLLLTYAEFLNQFTILYNILILQIFE